MFDLSQKYNLQGKKQPAFVAIYEDLFRRIEQEEFKPGDQLPPEVMLAEKYGVSRNTLRQALAILREDGRIYNVQGKGSFISEHTNQRPIGFERLTNPAISCATITCTRSEVSYGFSPAALVVQQKLNLGPNNIALIADVWHYHDVTPISYTFVEIPVKNIPDGIVDLSDYESVENLLNNRIYDSATSALSRITLSVAEENISEYLNVPIETQVIFIEEILLNASSEACALVKHYLKSEYYNILVTRK